uniref:Uncharacterized protein n=1 Tax=Acrobeloides nanus TaxID=290746 RepID=A0A914EKK3_9BILA
MAAYPVSVKSNMSWEVTDLISWAAFERTELNLTALTKVNQADALEWAYTSSLLVFFHERDTIPNGNSVSYNIAPGEETTFTIKRNDYTRLNPPYGRCIHDKNNLANS